MKIFKKRKLSEEIEKYDNYRLAEVLELKDDIQPVADVAQADAFKSIKKLDKRAKEAFKEVEKNAEPMVKSTHNRNLGIVDKTDAMKKMGLVESFNKKFPSVDYSISHKNKGKFLKVYTESLDQAKNISTWASSNKIPCYIKKSKGVYSCVLKEEWVDEDVCRAGIAQDLNYLIKDELEAVEGYNSVLATWKDADKFPEVIAVLKDIVDEEMLHIGQLQRALELVSPNAKNIQAGAKEAEEQIVDEAEKQKEKEIEKAEEKFRDKIDVEVEDSIEDIEDGKEEIVDIDVVEESKKCKTKKLSEDYVNINKTKLEKEGIQYFGTKNQYNYDKMQLRIDHDNKTYQLGAFTHISKRETVSTPELKRIIERLKEMGYKETKKDNLKEEKTDKSTKKYFTEIGDRVPSKLKQEFKQKGIYVYEIRDNDTVQKNVFINNIGSLLTNFELLTEDNPIEDLYGDWRKSAEDNYEYFEKYIKYINKVLDEDVKKLPNGKWANVGKDGKANSGTFKTKKEAEAQMRAMYANGYKESVKREGMKDTLDAYVKGETLEEKALERKSNVEDITDTFKEKKIEVKEDLEEDYKKSKYSLSEIEDAVSTSFGFNKKETKDYIKKSSPEVLDALVAGFKAEASKSFLTDDLKKKIEVKEDLEEEKIEKGPFQVIWYVMEDDHPRCECFKEREKAIEYCNKHKEDNDKLEMQAVEVNDKDEIVDYLVL